MNGENEDRISKGFYSTFLNRSSVKMLAINKKLTNKKTWGGRRPFFVGAGGDENLKINFLWPKGGQINKVPLITGVRIAEMSQLQNCSVMCTKNGSYCVNEKKGEKKSGGQEGSVQSRVDVNGEVKLL